MVVPELPAGMHLDLVTGEITGTLYVLAPTATYTITAENNGGFTTFDLVITVVETAPTNLEYTASSVFTVGSPIISLSPTVSGNVTSYSIFPSLPDGLIFDQSTGIYQVRQAFIVRQPLIQ